jgi:hypothetical protein
MNNKEFHEFLKECIRTGDGELCRLIADLLEVEHKHLRRDEGVKNMMLCILFSMDNLYE